MLSPSENQRELQGQNFQIQEMVHLLQMQVQSAQMLVCYQMKGQKLQKQELV